MQAEIDRLISDMIGDGWQVIRRDVARDADVRDVKALIRQEKYDQSQGKLNPPLHARHVPVPYSGQFNPDGHDEHKGAWAADLYYAIMDGQWTDATVRTDEKINKWNQNVPGDGRFDQSTMPGRAVLAMGRVDLSRLPAFKESETALLKQYLDRDHACASNC